MSMHGWNSGFANVNNLNHEPSRSYGSSSTLLACRVCDKIFLSTHSLIEHYESHQDEFAQRRQEHLRNNYSSSPREPRRDGNSNNNPFQPRLAPSTTLSQRHHPYFPNGYRTLQPQVRERNPVATSNMFLANSRAPSLLQPRSSAANNSSLSVQSLNSFSVPGRSSVANTKHFAVQQSTNVSPPQASLTMRSDSVSTGPQPELTLKTPDQKGFDETADKVTVWYLGQLDHPIPNIIDLESDGKQEDIDLDLKL